MDQPGRLRHREVEAEHADPHCYDLQAVAAGDQDGLGVGHRLDRADRGVDPRQHVLGGGVDVDPGVHRPSGARHLTDDELGQVAWEG
jgi:hypothetical protein